MSISNYKQTPNIWVAWADDKQKKNSRRKPAPDTFVCYQVYARAASYSCAQTRGIQTAKTQGAPNPNIKERPDISYPDIYELRWQYVYTELLENQTYRQLQNSVRNPCLKWHCNEIYEKEIIPLESTNTLSHEPKHYLNASQWLIARSWCPDSSTKHTYFLIITRLTSEIWPHQNLASAPEMNVVRSRP